MRSNRFSWQGLAFAASLLALGPACDDTQQASPGATGQLLRASTSESDVASLSLPPIVAGQHSVIQIPIHAAAIDGLVAADLTVHFDPSVIRPRGAATGTLTPGWSLSSNPATPGEMRISLASSGGPVVGRGVLARLEFVVIGAPSSTTDVILSTTSLNGGAIPYSTTAGSVRVGAVYSIFGTVSFWANGGVVPDVNLHLATEPIHYGQPDGSDDGSSWEGPGPGDIGLPGAGTGTGPNVGQPDGSDDGSSREGPGPGDIGLPGAGTGPNVGQPDHTGGGSSTERSASGDTGLLGAGARLYVGQTDETGAYSIDGIPPSAFTLEASKNGGDNGITAYDASLVLQHASGVILLSGHAATAADVDKNGTIDSMDAFYILQRATSLIQLPFPGAGETWTFAPPSRSGTLDRNFTGQNFTGILLGDASGNYSSLEIAPMQARSPVGIRITESMPAADGSLLATVTLSPGATGVLSLDLVLRYDPSLGTPASVRKGSPADQWMMTSNLDQPGEIRISMAGAQPIAGEANLIEIVFETTASAQDVNLIAEKALANEDLAADVSYTLTLEHARFAARMATGLVSSSPTLLPKYDVAPLLQGESQPDGVTDIEDVMVILRRVAAQR